MARTVHGRAGHLQEAEFVIECTRLPSLKSSRACAKVYLQYLRKELLTLRSRAGPSRNLKSGPQGPQERGRGRSGPVPSSRASFSDTTTPPRSIVSCQLRSLAVAYSSSVTPHIVSVLLSRLAGPSTPRRSDRLCRPPTRLGVPTATGYRLNTLHSSDRPPSSSTSVHYPLTGRRTGLSTAVGPAEPRRWCLLRCADGSAPGLAALA